MNPVSRFGAGRDGLTQRGASSVEYAVTAGLLVLLLLVIVQVGVYFHLRTAAQTAARHGLDVLRVTEGTPEDGIATAEEFLDQAAGALRDPSVTAARTATTATVTVRGVVTSVVPGLALTIEVTVDAPVERIT